MAVRNGTTEWTDRLYRSANVPSYDAAYTVMLWFRIITAPDSYAYATMFSLRNESAGTWFQDALNIFNYPGVGYLLDFYGKNDNTVVEFLGSTALSTNTWYCAAIIRASDTDRRIYIGDASTAFAQDGSSTSALGSRAANPAAEANICESRSGVLEVGAVKVWTGALTLTQLQGEQYYDLAQYETNIRFVIPVVDTGTARGTDYSGSSYAFTTSGTMTDVTDPAAVDWDAATGTDVTVTAGALGFQMYAPAAAVTAIQNVTIAAPALGVDFDASPAVVSAIWNVTVAAGAGELALGIEASTVVTTSMTNITIDAGALGIDFDAGPAGVIAAWNVTIAAGACELAVGVAGGGVVAAWNVNVSTPGLGFEILTVGAGVAAVRNINIPAGIEAQGMEWGIAAALILIAEPIIPEERKLRIRAENRTLHIQKDERTLHIHAGNQTLRVQRDDRVLKIRPESRVIKIEG